MSRKLNNFYKKYFSELAFSLAKLNKFTTGPNPSVGCVVTNLTNDIISVGTTSINGRPHAEHNALSRLTSNTKKRIFVTMEPCSHFGKTPPCTGIIKKKNVKEVYYSYIDTNPIVNGNGVNQLKEKKILVSRINSSDKNFYKEYDYSVKSKVPYVTSKLALTKNFSTILSGKKYFTNNQSLKFAHLLRYINDSILVGKNTFLKDIPKLDCRLLGLGKFSPKIFVINPDLSIRAEHYNLYKKKITIFHASNNLSKIKKYNNYFHLIKLKKLENLIDVSSILKTIYSHGCRRLLIEGGLKTLECFKKNNYINKYHFIFSNLTSINTKLSAKQLISSLPVNRLSRYKQSINLLNDKLFSI